jgi:hypothetical protein
MATMNQPTIPAPTLTEQEAITIDLAMLEDKRNDGYNQRNDAKAMQLQLNYQLATGQFL